MAQQLSSPTRARMPSFDAVRVVCLSIVFIVHFEMMGMMLFRIEHFLPNWLIYIGHFSMDVFFVQSGFLVAERFFQIRRDQGRFPYAGFYMWRAFRIIPMFFAVTLLFWLFLCGRAFLFAVSLLPV